MRKKVSLVILISCFFISCNTPDKDAGQMISDATIGSLVQVISPESVPVEGIGLVGGLNGTGSTECPPDVREYLKRFILSEIPEEGVLNVDRLIDSMDTAVVSIEGLLPVEDSGNKYFDIKVSALIGTQTLSLENGWLYRSELKMVGRFGIDTDILADCEGPVFTDQIDNSTISRRTGYVLAGGKMLVDYPVSLVLYQADFELTSYIRNRINLRFGRNVAKAVQAGRIELTIPDKYKNKRRKFISIVKSMYLDDLPQNTQQRVNRHIRQMVDFPENDESEIALEAIGNQCLDQLALLLGAPDEHVRLRTARCMLNLRSNIGMGVLNEIARNSRSAYRIEALSSIAEAGRNEDASLLCRSLLQDDDFNIRLAAFEHLRNLNDVSVIRKAIASSFYLEMVEKTQNKDIYVSRSGQPRIVLFGSPIDCQRGIVIQSADGEIAIDAKTSTEYITIMRKDPQANEVVGQVRCSYEVSNIIRALCEDPPKSSEEIRGGLGVSYSDMIAFLKLMCDNGAINADFHAGPIPKIDLNIKK